MGTLTLNADGSASIKAATAKGNTLSFTTPPAVPIFPGSFPGSGSGGGTTTWTYLNGSVTVEGGFPSLSVAAGGRVLIAASANPNDGTDVLLILTRLQ